jgi:hypothetical protein
MREKKPFAEVKKQDIERLYLRKAQQYPVLHHDYDLI